MSHLRARKLRTGIFYYLVYYDQDRKEKTVPLGKSRQTAEALKARHDFDEANRRLELSWEEKAGPREGHIYFIQAADGGLIKVGFTQGSVSKRLTDLQAMCPIPLVLIFSLRGTSVEEKGLHKLFDEYRAYGEWFHDSPPIRTYMSKVRSERQIGRSHHRIRPRKPDPASDTQPSESGPIAPLQPTGLAS